MKTICGQYVVRGIHYFVLEPRRRAKHNVACQHSQQTQDVDQMLVQCRPTGRDAGQASNQHWFNASYLPTAAGLVVFTAGGYYKPTPIQYLLNVGPTSQVLASIHFFHKCAYHSFLEGL